MSSNNQTASDDLLAEGARAAEQFVRESKEIDYAFLSGRLGEWVAKRLRDELTAARSGLGGEALAESSPGP